MSETLDPSRPPTAADTGAVAETRALTDTGAATNTGASASASASAVTVGDTGAVPVTDTTAAAAVGVVPLSLGTAAAVMGEYRWIENALYTLLGEWVADMPVAAVKVHLDGQSLRHAWHAELWADRLPVLSGEDPAALTVPSAPASALFATLTGVPVATGLPGSSWPPASDQPSGRPGALPRLAGLYRVVLPRLVVSYDRHLRAASAVTDRPTARALRLVLNDEVEDWRAGEHLVQRLVTRPHDVAAVHEFLQHLETAVVGAGARSGLVTFPGFVPEE